MSPTAAGARVRVEGVRKETIETGRNRLLVTGALFLAVFMVIAGRLVCLSMPAAPSGEASVARQQYAGVAGRADIVDRNGVVLATSLPIASLYADPANVMATPALVQRLAAALPGLDPETVLAKLDSDAGFVWLKRGLAPRHVYAVNRLGIPGLEFRREERRVYPQGRQAAHVLGATDVDGSGIAGVELAFQDTLSGGDAPLRLSLDVRVQTVMTDVLARTMREFDAIGAAGAMLDVRTGEVLALVSLPDFDPNARTTAAGAAGFNRVTKGVYEMGSTFKLFTAAAALDSGTVRLDDVYDASRPIRIARFTITDFHPAERPLSVPEILTRSSNIGAVKMALDVGGVVQRHYLRQLGLLDRSAIELPEVGIPLIPDPWRDINTMTVAYGHGVAVSPLQLASAVAALVNGGTLIPPTLIKTPRAADGRRVLSEETSQTMRGLMRYIVVNGTGKNADVPGFAVGGKTGTAEKVVDTGYSANALISSFVAVFPMSAPRYVLLTLIDEPKGNEGTLGYATGGWVAAPATARLVTRIAPLLGLSPQPTSEIHDPALSPVSANGGARTRKRNLVAN
ncbi:MAG: penicillin-binding protein 2 [Rhodospirillales bacterium]|nr:penicillin-binding protein 2 [Rhodospirillales bacterium]